MRQCLPCCPSSSFHLTSLFAIVGGGAAAPALPCPLQLTAVMMNRVDQMGFSWSEERAAEWDVHTWLDAEVQREGLTPGQARRREIDAARGGAQGSRAVAR